MSAEVQDVLARIAVLQRTLTDPVSGLAVVAFENVPYIINTADMPLFVNYAGALLRNDIAGSDSEARTFNETRNYTMVLYHSPYGAGVEGEKFGLLSPYFKTVYDLFGSYPHLNNLGGVLDAKLTGDGGMATVRFANQDYYGVRFTLQVISKIRRPFAAGE